jgi:hypothetical protein
MATSEVEIHGSHTESKTGDGRGSTVTSVGGSVNTQHNRRVSSSVGGDYTRNSHGGSTRTIRGSVRIQIG